MKKTRTRTPRNAVSAMLKELGIPVHRIGHTELCVAIPYFSRDKQQCIVAELYTDIAKILGCSGWQSVEKSIREVITVAWRNRDPEVWDMYFPGYTSPPTNKQFIATLAEYI